MARPQSLKIDNYLKHPTFSTNRNENEFGIIQSEKGLPLYSRLIADDHEIEINKPTDEHTNFTLDNESLKIIKARIQKKIEFLSQKIKDYDQVKKMPKKLASSTSVVNVEIVSEEDLNIIWKRIENASKFPTLEKAVIAWIKGKDESVIPVVHQKDLLEIFKALWVNNKENKRKKPDWIKGTSKKWLKKIFSDSKEVQQFIDTII